MLVFVYAEIGYLIIDCLRSCLCVKTEFFPSHFVIVN